MHKAVGEKEEPSIPPGAHPGLWCQAANRARKTLGLAMPGGGGGRVTGPLCCLIVKPNILRGGYGAVHAHWGSRTNEKKRGQFLVMSLITGFCSILN